MVWSFFGDCRSKGESTFKKLELSAALQDEMAQTFSDQEEQFGLDRDVVDFVPGSAIDEDQIFVIRELELPSSLIQAVKRPDDAVRLTGEDVGSSLKAILGASNKSASHLLFQRFTRTRVINTSKLTIFYSKSTFSKAQGAGLILDNHLAAVYKGSDLYFRSFPAAQSVLPMIASYYQEATDDQLEQFANSDLFTTDQLDLLKHSADQWVRRRVAIVLGEGTLEKANAAAVVKLAAPYQLALETTRDRRGKLRIRLSAEKTELKRTLKFLCDEMLHSEFTGRRYEVPGKRRVGK